MFPRNCALVVASSSAAGKKKDAAIAPSASPAAAASASFVEVAVTEITAAVVLIDDPAPTIASVFAELEIVASALPPLNEPRPAEIADDVATAERCAIDCTVIVFALLTLASSSALTPPSMCADGSETPPVKAPPVATSEREVAV